MTLIETETPPQPQRETPPSNAPLINNVEQDTIPLLQTAQDYDGKQPTTAIKARRLFRYLLSVLGSIGGIVVVILVGIALTQSWYKWDSSPANSLGRFYLTKFYGKNAGLDTVIYYNYLEGSENIKTTFYRSYISLIIGFALKIILSIFSILMCLINLRIKSKKLAKITKIASILIAIAALLCLSISFFSFLSITSSFSKDQYDQCLTDKKDYKGAMCGSFRGHNDIVNDPGTELSYGPDVGWWLVLGAVIASLLSVIGMLATYNA